MIWRVKKKMEGRLFHLRYSAALELRSLSIENKKNKTTNTEQPTTGKVWPYSTDDQ